MSQFFIYIHRDKPLSDVSLESIGTNLKFFPWLAVSRYQTNDIQIVYTKNKSDSLDIFVDPDSKKIAILNGYVIEESLEGKEDGVGQNATAKSLFILYRESGISACIGLNGVYNLFIFNPEEQSVEAASDRLGIYQVFFAPVGNYNFVFTSSIVTLKSIPGYSPKISRRGIFDLLYMGLAFEERTILENVLRLLPNSSYRAYKGDLKLIEEKKLPFSDRNWGNVLPPLLDELEYRYITTVKRLFKTQHKIRCFLSGGKDSRLYSYILKKAGISPECITFGESYHSEVFLAREVSRVQGFSWQRSPIRRDFNIDSAWKYLYLDSFSRRIFPLSTFEAMNQLSQDCDYATGSYLADEIMGTSYVAKRIRLGDNEQERANNYLNFLRPFFYSTEELNQCFLGGTADYADDYRDEVTALLKRISDNPYHQMWGLWLRSNARLKVGGSIRALATADCLKMPCLDKDLMDFTFSLPPALLYNRFIIDVFLTRKTPRLAAIPLDQNAKTAESLVRGLKIEIKYGLWKIYTEKLRFPIARLSGYAPTITSQFYVDTFSLHNTAFQKLILEALAMVPCVEGMLDVKSVEKLMKKGLPSGNDQVMSGSGLRSLIAVIFAAKSFNS